MNEQLQQALTAILNKTMSGVDAGVNFLSAEIPDVIYQLLVWKASISALSLLACLSLCWVIYRVNAAQWKVIMKWKEEGDELIDHPEMMFNFFQLFLLIPVCGLFSLDWLQIWLAPKIYLIEYAASLAK